MLHFIKRIIAVKDFSLILEFNTGEIREVDLRSKLLEWSYSPDSKFRPLLDSGYFRHVKLDAELETVYWENGIDLCPDVLYAMSQTVKLPSVA
jgi:hypothetical protein